MSADTHASEADLDAVKQRQQKMWGTANYASIGSRILLVSELLCDAVDLQGGEQVLDVACGTGNAALAASRRFGEVTGVDYQSRLLDQARARAAAEGLEIDFREGDAEQLPFDDDAFDVVLSACGAMFAPDQQRTADELLRVCRPGGRIGMVNWTPDSWVGRLGRTVGQYAPPPAGVPSPVRWGDPDHLIGLFGDRAEVSAPVRTFSFRFASADDHADYFCAEYPPVAAALSRLDDEEADALRRDVAALAEEMNVSGGPGVVLPLDYLEVVARKG
ncbi:MAG: methyltransferase domain-containing protein [Acidimicrobiia bacterium]|nr:methyltransferase domain-containing protein [Acidimicrobiia bacterium]